MCQPPAPHRRLADSRRKWIALLPTPVAARPNCERADSGTLAAFRQRMVRATGNFGTLEPNPETPRLRKKAGLPVALEGYAMGLLFGARFVELGKR